METPKDLQEVGAQIRKEDQGEETVMVIYISGPYSNGGGTIAENIARARKVAIKLWEAGYAVVCPHLNTMHFETDCNCTWQQYVDGDKEILSRCDAILMLDGWTGSNGAVVEHDYAQMLGKQVYYDISELI